jgi:hypothetical protein
MLDNSSRPDLTKKPPLAFHSDGFPHSHGDHQKVTQTVRRFG